MYPAGFESAIPAKERPQTDALDRADVGICKAFWKQILFMGFFWLSKNETCGLKN